MGDRLAGRHSYIGSSGRTVQYETNQLQGVFSNVKEDDFFDLGGGRTGVYVAYETVGRFSGGMFTVLIEFLYDYPMYAPNAYVVRPELLPSTIHVYPPQPGFKPQHICYLDPDQWSPEFTSFDVAIMIQTWIYAYCSWRSTGKWDWQQSIVADWELWRQINTRRGINRYG